VISRETTEAAVRRALRRSQVVALVGPRQSGKTTLARRIVPQGSGRYFDLEDPVTLALFDEPMVALAKLRGTVIIDEVQRRPELFTLLRVLADRRPLPARFLVLGSASPSLLRQSSESLAGRIETIVLSGFSLAEVGAKLEDRHWLRGGFPRSFLAKSSDDSFAWRRDFIRTYLERDLPELGIRIPSVAMLRFWTMIAHLHGRTWSAAGPARSLGLSEPTVRRYLDLLTELYLVRQLQPYHANVAKRQVRSPKVYVRDSGLLHQLLGIRTESDLRSHPLMGASWEGYVIEQLLALVNPDEAYFWSTYQGAEIDLLCIVGGRKIGVEVKRADAPSMTPSMRSARESLELDSIVVFHPGDREYDLADDVFVIPASRLCDRSFSLPVRRRKKKRR
jgi:hypothetical protein